MENEDANCYLDFSELEERVHAKVRAAIKELWTASNERKKGEKNHVTRAYEFGIRTGLQALCLDMDWGYIEEWD